MKYTKLNIPQYVSCNSTHTYPYTVVSNCTMYKEQCSDNVYVQLTGMLVEIVNNHPGPALLPPTAHHFTPQHNNQHHQDLPLPHIVRFHHFFLVQAAVFCSCLNEHCSDVCFFKPKSCHIVQKCSFKTYRVQNLLKLFKLSRAV